ncbi:TIGR03435 family protein [Granulicella sp. L46]|uniref:TIGR03435 family protein n=1 Tax=Granulicella sp. L46 TaxID=1641865 RepID=UPI00131D1AD3|nr:TIGR03435 family protein [Granulicella sp. L46]
MMNRKTCLDVMLALIGVACTVPMNGQILHASGPLPSFEVETVKPWKAAPRPMTAPGSASVVPIMIDPGQHAQRQETDRVYFTGQVGLLIMKAYNLPIGSERRILKGPQWVESENDRYAVEAKIDASRFAEMQTMTPEQQQEQVALMEQSLLAERFNLKVHFEIRGETPVYALIIAKGGPKLTPSKDKETTSLSARKDEMIAEAVTVDQFARSPLWTPIGDRYVVDQTGLTGTYDFTLKWRSDPLDESGDLPDLFNAIREQLGLKVIDSKAPLEVIVIDHIERPSKN